MVAVPPVLFWVAPEMTSVPLPTMSPPLTFPREVPPPVFTSACDFSFAGFLSWAAAGVKNTVGKMHASIPAANRKDKLRRDSTGLVRLAGTSIFSRLFQNALSCGFPPTSISVAQGPYLFVMAISLFLNIQ
jgi:hypothetical protein